MSGKCENCRSEECVVIDFVDKAFIKQSEDPRFPDGGEKWILSGRSGSGKGVTAKT